MVDFLDHLLEWSGDHAIFLLVLSRPEGTDRRGLVLSRRSVTTLPLDPLSDEVMGELLDGLVTGLPQTARARIVERAEGIPLYAIETVRGLLDKGVLEKGDDGLLHLRGDLGELETPPGLTALIASRLDALGPDERRLVKECSVLGGSFPRQGVEAVSDIDPGGLDKLLSSLVRKEVLTVRADKFSPERGQYAFTQSLIRSVAYDMLTRSERKARHLRTAEHLRTAFPDEGAEVSEVIAAHLHDAYRAAGNDADADELRARASAAYRAAAERAESVGAPDAAEVAYTTALELSTDEAQRAELAEKAGRMAFRGGFNERAASHLEAAIAGHTAAGRVIDAARVTAPLSWAIYSLGRTEEAIDLIRETLASVNTESLPPVVVAELQAYAGTALAFTEHPDEAHERLDAALVLSQQYELAEPLAIALNLKALLLAKEGRVEEARLLLEGSLAVAKRHALEFESTAENNLAVFLVLHDLAGAEEHLHAALGLARRLGARQTEAVFADSLMNVLITLGRFDEAEELGTDVLASSDFPYPGTFYLHLLLGYLDALRGRLESARQHFGHVERPAETAELQSRVFYGFAASVLAFAKGDFRTALDEARQALAAPGSNQGLEGLAALRECLPVAIDAALALQAIEEAEKLVDVVAARPPGATPLFLRAQLHRACALVSAARGDTGDVEAGLEAAEKGFRDLNYPYWTARVQLDLAEWLARQGRLDESARIATEAAAAFETLGAAPMLAHARALLEPEMVRNPGADAERAVAQGRPSLSE
jgi:tetratricopeptide (TPR) repeat protein